MKKEMGFLSGVQKSLKRIYHFPTNQVSSEYSTSWEFSNGEIKFKFFDLGEHRIAHRAWSDYNATMDAVVYVVNADALTKEELLGPREELNSLLSDEAFAEVPVLIFGVTSTGSLCQLKERLCYLLGLPNDTIAYPLKVFVAQEYLDGFKWLSRYIK